MTFLADADLLPEDRSALIALFRYGRERVVSDV
jgi:hypothetical protein